ncbi:MAG: DUF481 domain-containing protein [Flavobacterium sp.]|jgi:hypothetical protein|uniref:DUF481 domain-containing protein n=1 Tax=Flavobacterium sp. TaxID=239 RepID=UPI003BA69184
MIKTVFFFLSYPLFLTAQINESDTLKIKAGLSLSGLYQGGNVETLIFRAKTDFSCKPWKNWVFKNQNSYVYQAFDNEKADEDILILNFLYLNPDRKVYPFILSFVSTNFRREISLRYLAGAGATFQIFNKKVNWLKLSISSEYEKTNFLSTDFNFSTYDGTKKIQTIRGTIWVNGKYNLFKKKVIFNHEVYFQPSLKQNNNFRWQGDIGIELPIFKLLNFTINYRHTFESIVIVNQKQEDRFLTAGFTLKNY